ncbi:MAG: A/G-specific adenine glycosylase [Spirochaetaceae bacterium]|nr:MAG: A/G-specific adenine glycosylase [Spirochaetaceae bacterium]
MPDIPAGVTIPVFDLHPPELSHRLMTWFFRNRRELPWREEHDPYRVWISEVMLQQTRCETAAHYYRRWMTRFPTLESLAGSDQEDVLKAWEGMGYYSRARNLHRSARIICENWGGAFPDTEERIRSLPGVGEYTAAAVLSIAFAKPLGVVDGNVLRVVSRLLAVGGPAERSPAGRRSADQGHGGRRSADKDQGGSRQTSLAALKRLARAFVEASFLDFHPGWINQAWMELGALICLPKPVCDQCPLSYSCRAYREDRIQEFPPGPVSRPLPVRAESLLLLLPALHSQRTLQAVKDWLTGTREHKTVDPASLGALLRRHDLPLLLVRRAGRGLLGGLWELPNFPERNEELANRVASLAIKILLDTGQEVRHRYSHFEIRFRLLVAQFRKQQDLDSWTEQRWVLPSDLVSYPRPKVHIEAMRRFGLIEK